MRQFSWRQRLHYGFDNTLSRGPIALVGWLALVSFIFVLALAILATLAAANPEYTFMDTLWTILLQALAPNPVDVAAGPPLFLAFMFVVTLGGIFLVSLFIGVLTNDLDGRLQELRRGRSHVVEYDHTVILGWSQQVYSIISELAIAHAHHRRSCIVILADRSKVDMEDDIRRHASHLGKTRVVCRSGDAIDMRNLELVSLDTARSIIVLAPDTEDPDASVLKTVLAITNNPARRPEPYRIVAEIRDPQNRDVAGLVGRNETEYVMIGEVIGQIIAQTCRQAGLSSVYTELLDFEGDEIYMWPAPSLVGREFGEILTAYEKIAVIGILPRNGDPKLNPPMETRLGEGDEIIVIAEDDDSVPAAAPRPSCFRESAIMAARPHLHAPERTLILGWNWRAPIIISHLDRYVPPESTLTIVASVANARIEVEGIRNGLRNMSLDFRAGDTTDRRTLDGLAVASYNHVVILCYSDVLSRDEADAHTLMTLLHLRDIAQKSGHTYSIVSEMLDIRNRNLAEVTRADDFVVSDNLISLMLAQISESNHLNHIFKDLFDPEGSEIYLRPAGDYVQLGQPLDFYTVLEAGRRRGEVAIGYRMHTPGDDPLKQYGVIVNPSKSSVVTYSAADKIIILAQD
jgi:voltage-gated potassium channel Kch